VPSRRAREPHPVPVGPAVGQVAEMVQAP
jgi:hypothetical protein